MSPDRLLPAASVRARVVRAPGNRSIIPRRTGPAIGLALAFGAVASGPGPATASEPLPPTPPPGPLPPTPPPGLTAAGTADQVSGPDVQPTDELPAAEARAEDAHGEEVSLVEPPASSVIVPPSTPPAPPSTEQQDISDALAVRVEQSRLNLMVALGLESQAAAAVAVAEDDVATARS